MKYAFFYCTAKTELREDKIDEALELLTDSEIESTKRSVISRRVSSEDASRELTIKESRIYTIRDDSGRYIVAEWYEIWETDEDDSRIKCIDISAFPPSVVIDDCIYRHESYGWSCYGFHSEAEEVAEKLRASGEWDIELAGELCRIAGLEDEWDAAEDNFESVVEKAADILKVEIY